MLTIRHLNRLWSDKNHTRLFRDLLAYRPDAAALAQVQLAQPFATAALGLIRLHELHQDHTPLYTTLLRHLLAAQQSDGGWSDPATTSICLRALLLGQSARGDAIDRALTYLAHLQKSDGLWPSIPIRRLPADPEVSAFILSQLVDAPRFTAAIRLDDAFDWFDAHASALDPHTRALWQRARTRCRARAHLAQFAENFTKLH